MEVEVKSSIGEPDLSLFIFESDNDQSELQWFLIRELSGSCKHDLASPSNYKIEARLHPQY
jgi:hypothetical protein